MVSSFLHKFPKAYNHNHSRESRVCDMRTEQDCFESVSLIFNECIDCHFLVIKCFESQRTFSVGVFKTREGMIWLLQIGMIHLTYDYY
jgi:methionine-rich copper-binding protein CopC